MTHCKIQKSLKKTTGNWSPSVCIEGPHQSPIALSTSLAEEADFPPFRMDGYWQNMSTILQNNGHSVTIRPNHQKHIPRIHGGGLSGKYKLDHLHFHWKSEHTMEGQRFPLEMHMVHYHEKYSSYQEASDYAAEGGVVVFAVLFYLSPDDVEEFNHVLKAVLHVQKHENQQTELDGFVIKNFIPMDVAGFYRYNGSLTSPGCNEGIIWTVFVHTLPISQAQVDVFRSIRTRHNKPLEENFRELQPLNDRHILIKISPVGVSAGQNLFAGNANVFLVIFISIKYCFSG
ncbi:unnamed protein product [Psylliodes chrysocephalus]|uniref:Carbonic anhydrase n=1 Tax=Psylliodes chrysocephalus TaxID=3402493 RepID=A0A9P0CDQ2_9CUCU|nr:unnamed protein product [Psylliodes chrysocephala]